MSKIDVLSFESKTDAKQHAEEQPGQIVQVLSEAWICVVAPEGEKPQDFLPTLKELAKGTEISEDQTWVQCTKGNRISLRPQCPVIHKTLENI